MTPEVALIQQPAIDFGALLTIASQALGYSPAAAGDASPRNLSPVERYLAALAAMHDEGASVEPQPGLLDHVSYGVLLAATQADTLDLFACTAGMAHQFAETVRPDVLLSIISGTLGQWRSAMLCGTNRTPNSRAACCKIIGLFERVGLGSVWNDYTRKPVVGGFLLEDKR